jgi:subtilase family serine protease
MDTWATACGASGGTSFSSPIWAGFIALANQRAALMGNPSVGFLNPAIYDLS